MKLNKSEIPLVSIVIPTFNQIQYLPACIDHCLFQTYQNLEILIVDGGSTDGTKEYLADLESDIIKEHINPVSHMTSKGEIIRKNMARYPQNRSIYILTFQNNIGATETYNKGLRCVRGKYCTYVVGDDLPHPHMIEDMVKILEKNTCDFVYSDINLINDEGRIVRQMIFPDYDFKNCFSDWYHIGVSHLYRTILHRKAGLMNTAYRSANDYDHYLRFAIKGCRFFHLNKVLYSIRHHGEERKTGQHTGDNYRNLLEESKKCALRAREWLKRNG